MKINPKRTTTLRKRVSSLEGNGWLLDCPGGAILISLALPFHTHALITPKICFEYNL